MADWLRDVRDILVEEDPSGGQADHQAADAHLAPPDASAHAYTHIEHVGKSERQLRARLHREPHLAAASTFFDDILASRGGVDAMVGLSREEQFWLQGEERTRSFFAPLSYPLGIFLVRGASRAIEVAGVEVVLQRSSAPGGSVILTAFPAMWLAHLGSFLGAWFNADWKLDHPDVEDVVRAFRNDSSLARISGVVNDIDALLEAEIPSDSLRALMLFPLQMHAGYDPTRETPAMAMDDWLQLVRDILVSGQARRPR